MTETPNSWPNIIADLSKISIPDLHNTTEVESIRVQQQYCTSRNFRTNSNRKNMVRIISKQ